MAWQDIVIAGGNWVLFFALIPALRSKTDKPPVSTSLMMGTVITSFAVAFATLSLWFSAIATAAAGSGWFALTIQKYLQNKRNKK